MLEESDYVSDGKPSADYADEAAEGDEVPLCTSYCTVPNLSPLPVSRTTSIADESFVVDQASRRRRQGMSDKREQERV